MSSAADKLPPAERDAIRLYSRHFSVINDGNQPYYVDWDEDGTAHVVGKPSLFIHLQRHSLNKIPVKIGEIPGGFSCTENELEDLVNAPQRVPGDFFVGYQPLLKSYRGGPRWVGKEFDSQHTTPQTLEGIPDYVGREITLRYSPDLGLLRLLLVQGDWDLDLRSGSTRMGQDVEARLKCMTIINKYRPQGRAGLSAAATELIKAGLRGNARL